MAMQDKLKPCPSGKTTEQMRGAPLGAVYVWANGVLRYPHRLARQLGRDDLVIVSPQWVEEGHWHGLRMTGVILDHAAELSHLQAHEFIRALARVSGRWE